MSTPQKNSHDEVVPAKAQRHGRQKGVRLYIPESALLGAFTRGEQTYELPDPLYYKVLPWGKKSVIVRFGAENEL